MRKRVLILGVRGMLGHVVFRHLSCNSEIEVHASTTGATEEINRFPEAIRQYIHCNIRIAEPKALEAIFSELKPDVTINCVAMIRPVSIAADLTKAVALNTTLPHRIAKLCNQSGTRFIHISTDSMFGGKRRLSKESDPLLAPDLYTMTKVLGEVSTPGSVTIRTSIIGHELENKTSFVEWFLSQENKVRGYSKVLYTGMPTIELARIINEFIIPNQKLNGTYHVSSDPVSKYDILQLIAGAYRKSIEIEEWPEPETDNSLDSSRFRKATGYSPSPWSLLVRDMHQDYLKHVAYYY